MWKFINKKVYFSTYYTILQYYFILNLNGKDIISSNFSIVNFVLLTILQCNHLYLY